MSTDALPQERRQTILNLLLQNGKLVSAELSQRLGVSEDTVRRDLRELDEAGLLTRVHGGALPRSPTTLPYAARRKQNMPAKTAIAKEAARFIKNGQVVIMDGGTTTEEVAGRLEPDLTATFITNSPNIALALSHYPNITLIMTGGVLQQGDNVLTGSQTLASLREIKADLCLLGICSLNPEFGVTAHVLEEAYVKRLMIERSAETVALCSAEKLGTAAPYVVSPLRELDYLVTEASVSDEMLEPYKTLGLSVSRA